MTTGYTLIELMVATILVAFAVSLVFMSWNYMSRYTILQQRKSIFQAEADRIDCSIITEIRNSPEVISWNDNAIRFLSSINADTVSYEYTDGTVLRNGSNIPSVARTAHITQFSIESDHDYIGTTTDNSVMLVVTIGIQDNFNNSSVTPLIVKINMPNDRMNFVAHNNNL